MLRPARRAGAGTLGVARRTWAGWRSAAARPPTPRHLRPEHGKAAQTGASRCAIPYSAQALVSAACASTEARGACATRRANRRAPCNVNVLWWLRDAPVSCGLVGAQGRPDQNAAARGRVPTKRRTDFSTAKLEIALSAEGYKNCVTELKVVYLIYTIILVTTRSLILHRVLYNGQLRANGQTRNPCHAAQPCPWLTPTATATAEHTFLTRGKWRQTRLRQGAPALAAPTRRERSRLCLEARRPSLGPSFAARGKFVLVTRARAARHSRCTPGAQRSSRRTTARRDAHNVRAHHRHRCHTSYNLYQKRTQTTARDTTILPNLLR